MTSANNNIDVANTGVMNYAPTNNPIYRRLLAIGIVLAMLCSYLIVDAILPLYGLWFHTASLGLWSVWLTRLLFPGWQLTPTLLGPSNGTAPPFALSWETTGLFLLAIVLVFLCYLVALRLLPRRVSISFIVISTALFGFLLLIAPTVTSQDIYSYTIYARMQVLYHLNPLITSPMSIMRDPTYIHLYWTNQPSAYGPTWIALTSPLQWVTASFGTTSLTPMLLALRTLGLLAHLGSTLLLWSLTGQLQYIYGYKNNHRRTGAVLAFAWNPLLLFEASVNGHNDAVMLFFVLLALWCLLRFTQWSGRCGYLLAAFLFALATCLKVNIVLLVPGLFLFVWWQSGSIQTRLRNIALILAVYILTILVLYAPFWSHGSILLILRVNPGTSRSINSLPEFFSHLYDSLTTHATQENGFTAEVLLRYISEGLFVVSYLGLCWYGLRRKVVANTGVHTGVMNYTPTKGLRQDRVVSTGVMNYAPTREMIRWMVGAWLLYCFLGSPWFWPWYLVTFLGLLALLETLPSDKTISYRFVGAQFIAPVFAPVFAFCMLSLYCFYTWSPYGSFVPHLFQFRWAYLRGLWAWLPFLLLLCISAIKYGKRAQTKKYHTISRDIADR